MPDRDAVKMAEAVEAVKAKLELFGDHFTHLANTDEQRKLADEFNLFVGQFTRGLLRPPEQMEPEDPGSEETKSFLALHGHETLFGLMEEIRADEAAGKREDSHWYGRGSYEDYLDRMTNAPAPEKGKDHGIER